MKVHQELELLDALEVIQQDEQTKQQVDLSTLTATIPAVDISAEAAISTGNSINNNYPSSSSTASTNSATPAGTSAAMVSPTAQYGPIVPQCPQPGPIGIPNHQRPHYQASQQQSLPAVPRSNSSGEWAHGHNFAVNDPEPPPRALAAAPTLHQRRSSVPGTVTSNPHQPYAHPHYHQHHSPGPTPNPYPFDPSGARPWPMAAEPSSYSPALPSHRLENSHGRVADPRMAAYSRPRDPHHHYWDYHASAIENERALSRQEQAHCAQRNYWHTNQPPVVNGSYHQPPHRVEHPYNMPPPQMPHYPIQQHSPILPVNPPNAPPPSGHIAYPVYEHHANSLGYSMNRLSLQSKESIQSAPGGPSLQRHPPCQPRPPQPPPST
jgi:hypothetical protein